jgi:hypothetical protein
MHFEHTCPNFEYFKRIETKTRFNGFHKNGLINKNQKN